MAPIKKPKTVLLTGAAGYVGSHTALELLNSGYDIVAVDNCINAYKDSSKKKPTSLMVVEELAHKSLKYHHVDMLNKDAILDVFRQNEIDIVIHFAALKAVGESVNEPLRYYSNNLMGAINLIEAMKKSNVYRLVFSSSATVYGTPEYQPIDENHPTGQGITNPYGQTKYMCEQIMRDVVRSDQYFNVILLRYFNPVGAHESGLMGEDPKGKPNNLMPFVAQVAVGKRPFVEVFGSDYDTEDGTGVRDYIHVVDLALGHLSAVDKIVDDKFSGCSTYNLGTGIGVSVLQMIEAYSRACGTKLCFKTVGRREGDVCSMIATCQLAEKELGWKATKNLDQMCIDSWRWQNSHPDGFATKTTQ